MTNPSFTDEEYINKTFSDLVIPGAKVECTEFDGCTFINCDLSETLFYKCKFIDCSFVRSNLSVINLKFSQFSDVSFDECKMPGIDWTQVSRPNLIFYAPVKFNKCILNDSSFFGLDFPELEIIECKAHNVDFREGDFKKSNFSYTSFSQSLFNNTNLKEVNFCEAVDYQIDINLNTVKGARFTRQNALCLLESLGIELID